MKVPHYQKREGAALYDVRGSSRLEIAEVTDGLKGGDHRN